MKKRKIKGVSLIELLIVLGVFSVLAILAASGVFLSLKGSRKSEALGKVRENLDYSFAVIERQLRNAESVNCASETRVDYEDKHGNSVYFSCENVGTDGYISSASAKLTGDEVAITACTFTCEPGVSGSLPAVTIDVVGKDKSRIGAEAGQVNLTTKVHLRTY